jgi:hypothetical protein
MALLAIAVDPADARSRRKHVAKKAHHTQA